MNVSVCLSVRAPRISPEPYARSLPTFVHAAYVRGSVLSASSIGGKGATGVHNASEVYCFVLAVIGLSWRNCSR